MMPSMLGPTGITDWVNAVGKLCRTSNRDACSNAQSARVQVLTYSAHHFLGHMFSPRISGRFEVGFGDGTRIEGTFTAKQGNVKNIRKRYVNENAPLDWPRIDFAVLTVEMQVAAWPS